MKNENFLNEFVIAHLLDHDSNMTMKLRNFIGLPALLMYLLWIIVEASEDWGTDNVYLLNSGVGVILFGAATALLAMYFISLIIKRSAFDNDVTHRIAKGNFTVVFRHDNISATQAKDLELKVTRFDIENPDDPETNFAKPTKIVCSAIYVENLSGLDIRYHFLRKKRPSSIERDVVSINGKKCDQQLFRISEKDEKGGVFHLYHPDQRTPGKQYVNVETEDGLSAINRLWKRGVI